MVEPRKLYRSSRNKIVSGICGGLGEYFDIDPVMVRALYAIATIASIGFPGVIVYIILSFVIPQKMSY